MLKARRLAATAAVLVLTAGCGLGAEGSMGSRISDAGRPPAASPTPTLAPGQDPVRVPILMYHYVRGYPDPRVDYYGYRLSVSPADFSAQMDWLQQHGYHPVNFDDLQGYLHGTASLPLRPVILTFDDGYADFFRNALPVLRAHHFQAVSYIVTGFLGRPDYMTAAQVRLIDRLGVEIGSHTVHHLDLTALSASALHAEVFDSRSELEALLGHAVLDFCYPSGRYDAQVVQEVEAAGYRDATTTQAGSLHSLADRFAWTRVRVLGGAALATFAASVEGGG